MIRLRNLRHQAQVSFNSALSWANLSNEGKALSEENLAHWLLSNIRAAAVGSFIHLSLSIFVNDEITARNIPNSWLAGPLLRGKCQPDCYVCVRFILT